jgi:hypothetical protein
LRHLFSSLGQDWYDKNDAKQALPPIPNIFTTSLHGFEFVAIFTVIKLIEILETGMILYYYIR